jgi:hypothetical protein
MPRPGPTEIRIRAYQLYLEHGCAPGHEVDDWLQAEYELTQLPVRKLAELQPGDPQEGGSRLVNLVQAALFLGENI